MAPLRMNPIRSLADARLGTVLRGVYRLEAVLGRGGTGVVYRATDERDGRAVAVKVLRRGPRGLLAPGEAGPPGAAEEDARSARRFAREARIVAALSHPHIVRVFAFEPEDPLAAEGQGEAYIAMELLTGHTLGHVLEGRRLTPAEALRLYGPLCDAMAYAHGQGVVHRDLKPDNVFLVGEDLGVPRVLDFGISKVRDPAASQLTEDTILGTPAYMAPELVRAPADVDARADVFALGAMLYHALTGRPPFDGETLLSVLHKVLTEEAPPARQVAPDVPPAVERVLARALARDPAARFPGAAQLHAALRQALAEAESAGGLPRTALLPVVPADLAPTRTLPSVQLPVMPPPPPPARSVVTAPQAVLASSGGLRSAAPPHPAKPGEPPPPVAADPDGTAVAVPDLRGGRLPRHWPLALALGALLGVAIGLAGLLWR